MKVDEEERKEAAPQPRGEGQAFVVRKESIFFGKHLLGAAILCIFLIPFILYPFLMDGDIISSSWNPDPETCGLNGEVIPQISISKIAEIKSMNEQGKENMARKDVIPKEDSAITVETKANRTKQVQRAISHIVLSPLRRLGRGLRRLTKASAQVLIYPITPLIAAIRALQLLHNLADQTGEIALISGNWLGNTMCRCVYHHPSIFFALMSTVGFILVVLL